jgi:CIC family chloride channel protein
MQLKKLLNLIRRVDLNPYYKAFMLWRLKNLTEYQFVIILSLVVGLLSGLASVVLKNTVHFTYELISGFSWFSADRGNVLFLIYPTIGIILTVMLIKYFIKDDLSHGVSKVMYSISRKNGRLKFHHCWSSVITSSITVAFGGSVGLEAPIVLTCSAIGSNISRFFRISRKHAITLLACGAAGAIAGVFKAPIAGVLFAFEVLMIDLTLSVATPLLLSALSSAFISYFFFGQGVQFYYKVDTLFELSKIPAFVLLGIISAFMALYFLRINRWVSKKFSKYKQSTKIIVGGVVLGLLVYIFPPLFGEGYSALTALLNNDSELMFENSFFHPYVDNELTFLIVLVAIVFFKAIATAVTCSSGGVGGTFAPSLFLGGFVGFFVARVVNLSGLINVAESNFALVGMAAVMAGIMHSPLTATFLIAEITGGYALFTPLLIATTIAYLVVKPLTKYSIYAAPLAEKGDLSTHNKDKNALNYIDVKKLIETNFVNLNPDAKLKDIVEAVKISSRSIFPVVDQENYFKGVVVLDSVRSILFERDQYDKIYIKDYMQYSDSFIVDVNESMEKIVEKFKISDRYTLVVVEDGKYLGFISRANIFSAYQKYIREFSNE